MIISKKQIMQLVAIAHMFIKDNKRHEMVGGLTDIGKKIRMPQKIY